MEIDKHLIVISGPTAVGKTEWSIRLAREYTSPILSADSRQLYKKMDIGTAKPEKEILEEIRHYFIDHLDIPMDYSAGDYEREGLELLHTLFEKHSVLILAGGTGLYIDALCEGLDDLPAISSIIKSSVQKDLHDKGLHALHLELKKTDPLYFDYVDLANPRRVTRAIEVIRQSGRPFSSFRKGAFTQRPFKTHYIHLYRERDQLYKRINSRVDKMMEQGLLDEVESLYSLRHYPALNTVGYKELFDYMAGAFSLEAAIEKIKTHTRRYAKRQGTWFRRSDKWKSIHAEDENRILQTISKSLA